MKIFIIALALLFCTTVYAEDKKEEPKKFKTVFTVQYNEMTLEEAAKKEKEFRKLYKDACKVDVTLSEISHGTMTFSSAESIYMR